MLQLTVQVMAQVLGRVWWQEMRREIMAVALWREIVAGTVALPWPEARPWQQHGRIRGSYAAGDAAGDSAECIAITQQEMR